MSRGVVLGYEKQKCSSVCSYFFHSENVGLEHYIKKEIVKYKTVFGEKHFVHSD